MMPPEARTVLVRDLSSGRIHIRAEVTGKLQSFEACNADQSGDYEVLDIANAPVDAYCVRCFPEYAKGDDR